MYANLVGLDGIDIDVAANLKHLYEGLGFKVILTNRPVPADLLVLMRGLVNTLDCEKYAQVHVYNYVGQDQSSMVLCNVRTVVFIDNFVQYQEFKAWRAKVDVEPVAEMQGLHPVYPHLWTRRRKELKWLVNHIGTFKPISGGDDTQDRLVNVIRTDMIPVWGRGWKERVGERLANPAISLEEVISIFAVSKVTLGIRYPKQRDARLISGRYWLAPLNGCKVLSDERPCDVGMPGVIFSSYESHRDLPNDMKSRDETANNAKEYWLKYTTEFETQLRKNLPGEKCLGEFFEARKYYYYCIEALKWKVRRFRNRLGALVSWGYSKN